MVLSVLDSIFDTVANPLKALRQDTLATYYRREGFNASEAQSLSWVSRHRNSGEGLGLLLGIGLVYFQNKRLVAATFKYR
jgi:hypothetical protein